MSKNVNPRRGEVWWIEESNIESTYSNDHSQRGKRPGVVVSSDHDGSYSVVTVAWMTTSSRKERYSKINILVDIAGKSSYVMCNQLATVDVRKLSKKLGVLSPKEKFEVDKAILYCQGFESLIESYENLKKSRIVNDVKVPQETFYDKRLDEDYEGLVLTNDWTKEHCKRYLEDYGRLTEDQIGRKYHLANINTVRVTRHYVVKKLRERYGYEIF